MSNQILIPEELLGRSAPVLIIDGPEKAGKTTLVKALSQRYGVEHRSLGDLARSGAFHSYGDILRMLQGDQLTETPMIWDRSWITNLVFSKLGHNPYGIEGLDDSFVAEWLFGRILTRAGSGLILLGPDANTLSGLRDSDDYRGSAHEERSAYEQYGVSNGYITVANKHSKADLERLASFAWPLTEIYHEERVSSPLASVGAQTSKLAFLEEPIADNLYSGLLPGSGPLLTQVGKALGPSAKDVIWARPSYEALDVLGSVEVVFTTGAFSHDFAGDKYLMPNVRQVIPLEDIVPGEKESFWQLQQVRELVRAELA